MLTSYIAVLAGFVLLVWGADRFVAGASGLARNLGVQPLIIGLTIVGFATSAPEMLVSSMAAWEGNPGMGLGNAVGSNITNIAMVLGITALIKPMSVHSSVLQREFPILFMAILLCLAMVMDGELTRLDGIVMLVGLIFVLYWIVILALDSRKKDPMSVEFETEIPTHLSTTKTVLLLLLGIATLLISSRILVWGAVNIAHHFGVSDLIIGLTIIAIGTSLPELAATIMSALKNEHDIAIGNIIGSNIFNMLGVFSMPAIIYPGLIDPELLSRDFPLMIGLTLALFIMAYGLRSPGILNRYEGGTLFTVYAIYLALLGNMLV